MDLPHIRLARFLEWKDASQEQFGVEVGRTQSAISQILAGKKLPDRFTANAIERATVDWPGGPITSEEWDVVESARKTGTEG